MNGAFITLKGKTHRLTAFLLSVVVVILPFFVFGCARSGEVYRGEGLLTVHYLDVGQSDCSFIEVGGEYTLMIDTADEEHSGKVCEYVRALGYERINALVITHPHADHIGGAAAVLGEFSVDTLYMNSEGADGSYFSELLSLTEEKGVSVERAERGVGFSLGEAEVKMLLPGKVAFEDENDNSAVVMLGYGERRFLFMGDCGSSAEQRILGENYDVTSDVVKVGHHGSAYASGEEFVEAVSAEYAVISCSAYNAYGHPAPSTVDNWERSGAEVFVTADISHVIAATDGEKLGVGAKNDAAYWSAVFAHGTLDIGAADTTGQARTLVLDTYSYIIHKNGCVLLGELDEKYEQYSDASVDRLEAEGFVLCARCREDIRNGGK